MPPVEPPGDSEPRPEALDPDAFYEPGALGPAIKRIGVDRLTRSWLRWHYRSNAGDSVPIDELDDDPDWWAVDAFINQESWEDEDLLRSALLGLIEAAGPDWDALGHVAAGPLEDFIDESADRLRWVEEQAARSATFRRALTGVWAWTLPESVFTRLERAAGSPLPRPKHRD